MVITVWVVVKIKYEVPYYHRDPKKDHNFDNHPYVCMYIYIYMPITVT